MCHDRSEVGLAELVFSLRVHATPWMRVGSKFGSKYDPQPCHTKNDQDGPTPADAVKGGSRSRAKGWVVGKEGIGIIWIERFAAFGAAVGCQGL